MPTSVGCKTNILRVFTHAFCAILLLFVYLRIYGCVLSSESIPLLCVYLRMRMASNSKSIAARECPSMPGASGLPYYSTPSVCNSDIIEGLAVWRHNNQKKRNECMSTTRTYHDTYKHGWFRVQGP